MVKGWWSGRLLGTGGNLVSLTVCCSSHQCITKPKHQDIEVCVEEEFKSTANCINHNMRSAHRIVVIKPEMKGLYGPLSTQGGIPLRQIRHKNYMVRLFMTASVV
jgi:hypothetical protein